MHAGLRAGVGSAGGALFEMPFEGGAVRAGGVEADAAFFEVGFGELPDFRRPRRAGRRRRHARLDKAAALVLGGLLLGGFFFLVGVDARRRGRWSNRAALLAITFAIYTFGGVEFVAVASGESSSAAAIARAVRMTFLTLTFLYLGAIVILVGIMPWNRAGVTESPFVTVLRSINIPGASHFMNFVVLTAALSGANAALYISSRMLFSLARTGWAPRALGRLSSKGTPTLALLVSSYGIVVALVLERWAPAKAFEYILRGAFFGMMLSWIISLAAHINFRRHLNAVQVSQIPARSPLGKGGSIIGLAVVVASIGKTWWDSRINLVAGLTFLVALTVLYFLLRRNATRTDSLGKA